MRLFLARWIAAYRNMDLRRRGKVLLILSVMLGGATGYLVLHQQAQMRDEMGTWVQVLVARKEIKPFSPLTTDMITARPIPVRYLLPGMIRVEEQNVLLRSVSSVKVDSGGLLTWHMFTQQTTHDPNQRTYTLTNSARVVFSGLRPGDVVDVIAVYDKDQVGVSEVVAAQVKVVAVWDDGRTSQVTLAVEPNVATDLAYYENYSRQLRLLRVG